MIPNFCQNIERRRAIKTATGVNSGKSTGGALEVTGVPDAGLTAVCADGTTDGSGLEVERGFGLPAAPSPATPGACQNSIAANKALKMRVCKDFIISNKSLRSTQTLFDGVFTP
jgi:hypothetical protein